MARRIHATTERDERIHIAERDGLMALSSSWSSVAASKTGRSTPQGPPGQYATPGQPGAAHRALRETLADDARCQLLLTDYEAERRGLAGPGPLRR
jgi:hypothetical protein